MLGEPATRPAIVAGPTFLNTMTHSETRSTWLTLLRIAVALLVIYAYPRLVVAWLGTDSPWTSYLYMYGLGFGFFSIGIWLILKSGACVFGRGRDTFWFGVLIGGFIFFAGLHAAWIVAAQQIPFLGAP